MRALTGDGGYSDADSTFQGFKKKKKKLCKRWCKLVIILHSLEARLVCSWLRVNRLPSVTLKSGETGITVHD